MLAGTLQGDVIRSGTVELEATARLLGNVEATKLVVRAGAFFDGHVVIGEPAASAPPAKRGEPSPASAEPARRRGYA